MTKLRSKLKQFAVDNKSDKPAMKSMINPMPAALTFSKNCPLNVALKQIDKN
jgi:hypothetical protein